MIKTIVHVIGGDVAVEDMFLKEGYSLYVGNEGPDLVCFTGGADVSPELYCQSNTGSANNQARDLHEIGQYIKYRHMGVPMVGICRGAQFLNVMHSGTMIQHKPGHGMRRAPVDLYDAAGNHLWRATDSAPRSPRLYEDHHQMMVPADHGIVLGRDSKDGNVEIILYDDTILCFQAHPEWGHETTRSVFFEMLELILFVHILLAKPDTEVL